jgi:hypothetical protein
MEFQAGASPSAADASENPSMVQPETACGDVAVTPSLDTARISQWMADEGYINKTLADELQTSQRAVSSMRNAGKCHGDRLATKLANLMKCNREELYR